MEEEQIRKIAREKGMRNEELFVRFMQIRFPNEQSPDYVGEWADRFLSGDPTVYMDDKSKEAYLQAINRG